MKIVLETWIIFQSGHVRLTSILYLRMKYEWETCHPKASGDYGNGNQNMFRISQIKINH